MSDDLIALEAWAGGLLAALQPDQRRRLNRQVGQALRRSQRQRIIAQRNPDGTGFAPRKNTTALRAKRGRIRRQMFMGLRKTQHLKVQADSNSIAAGFLGRTARIARIHQYGLHDRPARNSEPVQYAQRQLLGFTPADLELIRDTLLAHLAGGAPL